MSYQGPGHPFAKRRVRPMWLAVGGVVLLVLCACSGVALHALTLGGGKKDDTKASAQPAVPGGSPGGVNPSAAGHVMPSLIGVRLSDAEKRLKDAGFTKVHSSDATGQKRLIINHDNWDVRVQSPAAGTRGDDDTQVDLEVSKPSDTAGTTAPAKLGVVPDVVCQDLQKAQDAMQAAGYYVLSSRDGSGQGRHQLIDRNWVVTAQSATAGSRPKLSTRITLTVVKFGEPAAHCPT